MPNTKFVFNMTGVQITYNNVSRISSIIQEPKAELPEKCKTKYEKLPSIICSVDCDETKLIWNRPANSYATKTTQNENNYHKPSITLNSTECQQINTVITKNNCKSNKLNKSNGYDRKHFANSKCENKSSGSGCNSKSRKTGESRMSSNKQNSCHPINRSKHFTNNQSNVQNVKQFNVSNSNKFPKNETMDYDCTMCTNKISSVRYSAPKYSNTCKSMSIKPKMQNVQFSNRSSRQSQFEKCKEQQFSNNLVKLQKDKCENININHSARRNNSTIQPKSKQRSISVPCDYNRNNQNDKKIKQCPTNQNDSYSKFKHNNTTIYFNESINKSSLSAMNKCSDRDEEISKSRYDENWDPEIDDYSEFENRNYGNGSESSYYEGNNHSIQHGTSLNNFSSNRNTLSSNESCNSSWSTGTSRVNGLSSHPTYSNSSDSLTTLTSDLSSIETYPSLGFDSSSSTRSPKFCVSFNSVTDYSKDGDQINRDYSITEDLSESFNSNDYTNTGIKCPFNNMQKDISNINKSWSEEYQNDISMPNVNKNWEDNYDLTYNNIEDTSFPQMSYVNSCSSTTSFINGSQDIENMIMPNISYETSCSEGNTSVDDYTDF